MKEPKKQAWKAWAFAFGLNLIALIGVIYLKSKEIDVYAFRGAH